jgi:ribose transport system permease protein
VFWNSTNLTNAVGAFSSRGILAVGETLVILTAAIDLSVGSMLGLCSMVSALMLARHNFDPLMIVPLSMAIGALLGFINGAATTWLRIQSFVATLATLSIYSVGTQIVTKSGQLTPNADQFQALGTPGHNVLTGIFGGIYFPVLAFLVICIVFQLMLSRTRFGRHIYAVGGNETAARLSGVNVSAVRIAVFTLCGLLAGIAGPIDAAYSASADPLAGQSFELDAIAAAVIGGASLAGGKGTITGTLVGALILTLLDNILGLNNVSANLQLIIKGLIVIVAVVLQRPGFFTAAINQAGRLRRVRT